MSAATSTRHEWRSGIDAALQGAATAATPLLVFMGVFGTDSLAAAFWATLVSVTLVPVVRLLLGGHAQLIPGPRAASLVTYVGLVAQLGQFHGGADEGSLAALRLGLAAGSLMFAAASVLVLLAGWLRLGHVLKMIPTPVTAGISNGTALSLAWLAVQQVTHGTAMAAVTAVVMVACYFCWPQVLRRLPQLRAVSAIVVAMLAGLVLAAVGEHALVQRALPHVLSGWTWSSVMLWPKLWPELWFRGTGHLLLLGLPGAVTLALVMTLETFTVAALMETRCGVRADPNRELLAMGGANLVSSLMGGAPSTVSGAYSLGNWQAGGRDRLSAWVCIGFSAAMLLALGPWIIPMPAGLAAGLLLLQAAMMFSPPFVRRLAGMFKAGQWRSTDARDLGFWITLAITLVGFLGTLIWACFLGVALSCLAVLKRVSGNLTAQWAYLDHHRSRRMRSAGESDTLDRLAQRVGVLRLTGHLFFGNSARLRQLADELHPDAVAVVIDVSQVHDLDPSGSDALWALVRALAVPPVRVVISGMAVSPARDHMPALQTLPGVVCAVDMDRALEACEDQVLLAATVMAEPLLRLPLERNRLLHDMTADEITTVLMLGEQREVDKGEPLFHENTLADGVWLLEEGHVSVLAGEAEATRLATFGPGQFVGEMGLIDGRTRSATARADTPVRALLLDSPALAALVAQHPAIAFKITRNIAQELSHRVRNTSALLAHEATDAASAWANSTLPPSILSRF